MENELNTLPLNVNGNLSYELYDFVRTNAMKDLKSYPYSLPDKERIADDAVDHVLKMIGEGRYDQSHPFAPWGRAVVRNFVLNETDKLKRRNLYSTDKRIWEDSEEWNRIPLETGETYESKNARYELVKRTFEETYGSLKGNSLQMATMLLDRRSDEEMKRIMHYSDGALYAARSRVREIFRKALDDNDYHVRRLYQRQAQRTAESFGESAVLFLARTIPEPEAFSLSALFSIMVSICYLWSWQ